MGQYGKGQREFALVSGITARWAPRVLPFTKESVAVVQIGEYLSIGLQIGHTFRPLDRFGIVRHDFQATYFFVPTRSVKVHFGHGRCLRLNTFELGMTRLATVESGLTTFQFGLTVLGLKYHD